MTDEDKKSTTLKQEILDKMAALITAAFGLVAALAWNDTIKLIFKEIFGSASAIGPMLLYAIIVTIIAVILTIIVARASSRIKSMTGKKVFACKLCDYESEIEAKFLEHMFKEHAASQDKFMMK